MSRIELEELLKNRDDSPDYRFRYYQFLNIAILKLHISPHYQRRIQYLTLDAINDNLSNEKILSFFGITEHSDGVFSDEASIVEYRALNSFIREICASVLGKGSYSSSLEERIGRLTAVVQLSDRPLPLQLRTKLFSAQEWANEFSAYHTGKYSVDKTIRYLDAAIDAIDSIG